MKIFKFFILIVFLLLVILFVSSSIYLQLHGKELLLKTVEESLGTEVAVGQIGMEFPFGLRFSNVGLGTWLKVPVVTVQVGWASLWHREFHIKQLTLFSPEFKWERKEKKAVPVVTQEAPLPTKEEKKTSMTKTIFIEEFIIDNGRGHFSDATSQYLNFQVDQVRFSLQSLRIGSGSDSSAPFSFLVNLQHQWLPIKEGQVVGNGSLNWPRRDMQAQLKILEASQNLEVTSILFSENNALSVEGTIVYLKEEKEKREHLKSAEKLLDKKLSGGPILISTKFSFDTKMDAFEVNVIDFSGNVATAEVDKGI